MKQNLLAITAAFLLVGGCATNDGGKPDWVTPDNARIAAALICANTLNFAVPDAERVQVANYVWAIAHGIRTLSGGKVPTPAELRDAIELFAPSSSAGKWVTLATGIQAIYGGAYSQIAGDPKIALQYLEAIAAGCEDAASAFRPSPTPAS